MGASHSHATLSVSDDALPELEGDFGSYDIDRPLVPGSGRMMKTFQLRHKQNQTAVVLKATWVPQEHSPEIESQRKELERIKSALAGQPHVAPFLYWSVGEYKQKNLQTIQPIHLLRPYTHTTLSDRLASRPFLTHVEKLWISYQLLQALEAMHSKDVVHGFLTTENIGLTSWNWVVLVDFSSYKARTALPDDDPSEYLYYFQELYKHGNDTTPREKRCYLAPERFYTPTSHNEDMPVKVMEPAMDIFSAGCVLVETFLNGERALDLGDLMEYRKRKSSQSLQQKLNKIEFSAMRAACKHMMNLDPAERLSASSYMERLKATELIPKSFETMGEMMGRLENGSPDTRLAIAALYYHQIVLDSVGIDDTIGKIYVEQILGKSVRESGGQHSLEASTNKEGSDNSEVQPAQSSQAGIKADPNHLFAETEALLKKLDALTFDDDVSGDEAMSIASKVTPPSVPTAAAPLKKSTVDKSSLLVYLQLILSTVRYVQRPASKLVALQLMERLAVYSSDEARLQRIVPVAVSLLHDQDPVVRAAAINSLTSTICIVESFPPSDSKVFPQYIFKRVSHMLTDPSLIVRLAFARNIAVLAETSQRFLDISHAVKLYGVAGGGTNKSSGPKSDEEGSTKTNVFADDVAKLLDDSSAETGTSNKLKDNTSYHENDISRPIISNTYSADLSALQEIVSRFVVHIATDQSEHSSPVKRALLEDLARLCTFFGMNGVMAFILPQILSFLNDRKDWQLRASLFDFLPSLCQIIGRAATEHFVLPCLETALVDREEIVVSRGLHCLSQLLDMGLLSRSVIIGSIDAGGVETFG